MATAQAQIRKGRKFDQVVDGAREIFLRDGFEGASVDDIARAAGVSKATLYSYFSDKRLLFMEVATRQCSEQARISIERIDSTRPPQEVLTLIAQQFLGFIYSDMGQRIFRICVAESDRFPMIGQEFYHSGPMILRAAVVDYLKMAVARGELQIEDYNLAADQFAELCKADLWPKLIFGIITSVTAPEMNRVIDGAVTTFMARYGAAGAARITA
ncbi:MULTISPECIES: TetR/AcrR family transcriptional regulator [Marivita]|uniref:TetR/AcrR family transcriptional regulator n=1 Tax=Marivita cryptomonadis TaxID=505252 RepID=A0A9Q2P9L9_9RHOB|nr:MULTISPECIES: TetR/AcrR family transcriptional regulator [Marivita]MCR9168220.1 TetR/AcrR family transcriptional regulator [Paracoccaceae bacterium]MBM2321565.1 TetR/AcrR family transcriptional regulator [Marivita cryptomonadis]MBM2331146.1 TetR/AcrR family transcriptional regulator [Marivita cryptomonadis]MBM2340732.1 TetR/AcrR family transcriptional regulator [Marivita cryptomonadis]MBM2345394.1 TetR/AcrR family transcriptional regulator [Marivita cryptomonadis]